MKIVIPGGSGQIGTVLARTFLMRSESELVLKSRRVVPGRLLESGFEFQFSTWAEAAQDLCHRSRSLAD